MRDPSKDIDRGLAGRIHCGRGQPEGHQYPWLRGNANPSGITPTMEVRGFIEADGCTEDIRVAVEMMLPVVIADDQDGRRTGTLVLVEQRAADDGRDAGQPERRRRHRGDSHRPWWCVVRDQVVALVAERREILHRLERAAPLHEVVLGCAVRTAGIRARDEPALDHHHRSPSSMGSAESSMAPMSPK
jgi:hypothetical protein